MSQGLSVTRAARWHDAARRRRSRRSYTERPVSSADLDTLERLARDFRPWTGARVELVREAPAGLFMGIVGAYGGVSGASSAFVFVGSAGAAPEAVGFTGEALVLEATALGLDTCWVGGLFSAEHAASALNAGADERVYAVSPVGHAAPEVTLKERVIFGAGRAKRRRPLEEIAPGSGGRPEWASAAARSATVAPSAMNRQPWRFRFDERGLVVGFDGADTPRISKRLDCGIAMLHAELAVALCGVAGSWETLPSPDVARFVPGV
ncbi:MAG: nitroreductase [Coriobacteriia bacterium]|nr:nitroreductase [Coriobacteriia bacterium]